MKGSGLTVHIAAHSQDLSTHYWMKTMPQVKSSLPSCASNEDVGARLECAAYTLHKLVVT